MAPAWLHSEALDLGQGWQIKGSLEPGWSSLTPQLLLLWGSKAPLVLMIKTEEVNFAFGNPKDVKPAHNVQERKSNVTDSDRVRPCACR